MKNLEINKLYINKQYLSNNLKFFESKKMEIDQHPIFSFEGYLNFNMSKSSLMKVIVNNLL